MEIKEIPEYLEEIEDEKLKVNLLKLWSDLGSLFYEMPASVKYHHKNKGGLYQHTKEVVAFAVHLFESFDKFKSSGVNRDEVILIALVHDLDKVYKYKPNLSKSSQSKEEFVWNYSRIDRNDTADVVGTLAKYGIFLNVLQLNALSFSHGGWSVDRGRMKVLATLIHCADILSLAFEEGGTNGNKM
jgi:23S rRNA maturation-related 3'-5' exoribonuclease YhaM